MVLSPERSITPETVRAALAAAPSPRLPMYWCPLYTESSLARSEHWPLLEQWCRWTGTVCIHVPRTPAALARQLLALQLPVCAVLSPYADGTLKGSLPPQQELATQHASLSRLAAALREFSGTFGMRAPEVVLVDEEILATDDSKDFDEARAALERLVRCAWPHAGVWWFGASFPKTRNWARRYAVRPSPALYAPLHAIEDQWSNERQLWEALALSDEPAIPWIALGSGAQLNGEFSHNLTVSLARWRAIGALLAGSAHRLAGVAIYPMPGLGTPPWESPRFWEALVPFAQGFATITGATDRPEIHGPTLMETAK